MRRVTLLLAFLLMAAAGPSAQAPYQPDFPALESETLKHFQALVRMDTSDPPGVEKPAAEYVKQVLEAEGIPVQLFAVDPNRPNLYISRSSARLISSLRPLEYDTTRVGWSRADATTHVSQLRRKL